MFELELVLVPVPVVPSVVVTELIEPCPVEVAKPRVMLIAWAPIICY